MRAWIPYAAGLATAAAIAAIGGLVVVETGAFDVRASTPHSPIVAWAAHTTMIHATAHGAANVTPPRSFTPLEVVAGFRFYDEDCATCHGAPGVARAHWTDGLTPSPPYLVDAPRHWTKPELYWIVSKGVKMTAMPAWQDARSSGQIWDIVAFLEAQPYLTAADYARLRERFPAQPAAAPLARR
jgi:mono/diheme cytochrome c family protein